MLRSTHQAELQSVISSYLPNTATTDFANNTTAFDEDFDLEDPSDDASPSSHHRTGSSHHHKHLLSLPATTNPPSPSNPAKPKVWLIFGATGHMGRSISKAAIAHNDIVCCVGQSYADTRLSMQNWYPSSPSHYLGLLCDVRIRSTVATAISTCISTFGKLDIIANCSGYGIIGSCEDQDEFEIRNQFETNFMGTLNIIQLSLPYFRQRGEGRYLIFSSTSGALGVPGLGPYCATKYAVEGLIESMLYEVEGFGIKLSLVEPGHMKRDDVHANYQSPKLQDVKPNGTGPSTSASTTSEKDNSIPKDRLPLFGHFRIAKPSPPYDTQDAPANHARRILQWIGDHQPTSVAKAAELVWQLGHCSYPPLRLLLGTFAVESVRDRLKSVIEEIEDWKYLHFPPAEGDEEEGDGEGEEHEGEDGSGNKEEEEDAGEDGGEGEKDDSGDEGEALEAVAVVDEDKEKRAGRGKQRGNGKIKEEEGLYEDVDMENA